MRTSLDYVLYLFAAVVVVGGAFGIYDAVGNPTSAPRTGPSSPGTNPSWSDSLSHLPTGRVLRIVVIGADERPGDPGRSDTLMVAFVNPATKKLALLSIPRDLRVHIPGHGSNKINAAFASGGVDLTVETVQDLLDQNIDYYVKVNLKGFVKAVDALGGVDITVPDCEGEMTRGRHHGMHYDDNNGNLHINLEPGRQHLNGKQAMGFVRYRHSKYGGAISDFQRVENQQTFLKELLDQKMRISQVHRLLKAGSQVLSHVEHDFEWLEVVDMLKLLRTVNQSDIYTATVPVGDLKIAGIYYAALREAAFHDELSRIDDYLRGRIKTDCPVIVYNGCGKAGIARSAAQHLQDAGFEQVTADNADEFGHQRTTIEYYGDTEHIARRAAETIACGSVSAGEVRAGGEDETDRLDITVGEDYKPAD
jgi:LCP family protein required for cell wall assembly